MPEAARISDPTNHAGIVIGPGYPTVIINGMPAAVVGDLHICGLEVTPPHLPSQFIIGSATVMIGGQPALRVGDVAGCGAEISNGSPDVIIG